MQTEQEATAWVEYDGDHGFGLGDRVIRLSGMRHAPIRALYGYVLYVELPCGKVLEVHRDECYLEMRHVWKTETLFNLEGGATDIADIDRAVQERYEPVKESADPCSKCIASTNEVLY